MEEGSVSTTLIACGVGGVRRSEALVTLPSLDVDRLSEEEPTPLRYFLTLAKQNKVGTMPSNWVLQIVKKLCHSMGFRARVERGVFGLVYDH